MNQMLEIFKQADVQGEGLIGLWVLVDVLSKLELDIPSIGKIMEEMQITEDGMIKYEDFVCWMWGKSFAKEDTGSKPDRPAVTNIIPRSTSAPELTQLQEIVNSLAQIGSSMEVKDPDASSALIKQVESLQQISLSLEKTFSTNDAHSTVLGPPKQNSGDEVEKDRTESSKWNILKRKTKALLPLMRRCQDLKSRQFTEAQLGFRAQAAAVLEKTGRPGECVDDLQQISISDVKDKLAISYWRFCDGLSVYRSETVSKAMRLICSAPVPGLGDTTYLDVFATLSNSTWVNHIYPFGGLVRDVLRRTVGNDIDIGFSAPAAELENICQANGYACELEGDYILIGDGQGEEYLEGMVISFNGIQPPEHADFSMNTLFYDFTNEIIIDKTGTAVPAVVGNKLDIPCRKEKRQSWIDINGVRVCFRYYKFLLRGYEYDDEEMVYVTKKLLEFWSQDAEHTIEVGRIALGGLVGSDDTKKIEKLRQFVLKSFEMANAQPKLAQVSSDKRASREEDFDRSKSISSISFFTASSWWQRGWLILLKLSA